jgi:glycogen(starch) synthase
LYWTEFIWPYIGGIQVMASQTLPALRRRGYEIAVVCSHGTAALPDEEERAGIVVHRFPIRAALANNDLEVLGKIATRIAALKRTFRADVVHLNFAGPSTWLHFLTSRAASTPLVVAFRGVPDQPTVPVTLLAQATTSAAWVVGVSHAVLDSVLESFPDVATRTSVIYKAFKDPAVAPAPIPFEAPRLLCQGRLVEEKCFHLAVDAMPWVLAMFPDAWLDIAGDGPERDRLERRVSSLGLESATSFHGWVSPDAVPGLLNETTLLVMPSRTEGLPGVAIQAAQMGRPVVATRVGGSSEVVAHGETGMLVENGNSEALGEAICSLLGDPGATKAMGERARRRAGRLFNWNEHVAAYDELYRRLL